MTAGVDEYGYPLVAAKENPDVNPLRIRHRVGPWRPYDSAELRRELEADEGNSPELYRCPAGFMTGGIGWNFDANGIPPEVVEILYQISTRRAEADLDRLDPGWRDHPDAVQRAMMNLCFNLGGAGWAKFKSTRAALARRDYKAAAKGLENSKWRKQVQRSRSDRIIAQVRGAG